MKTVTRLDQEDYIWAMRSNTLQEGGDSDVPRQLLFADRKPKVDAKTIKNQKQAEVMASLVPDEVIYNVDDYNHRIYEASFLFGDVSGFTELCEKYAKTGISGPSRMTQVLNKYLGSMVQEIMSHNGDVLKFSGDAFLAIFKISDNTSMRDTVHAAMDTALIIQKNYGSYLTDVGVVIRVKLAISTGPVTFALIGNVSNSHYVVVGQPIWDVKAAEHISSAGDIIVAMVAWKYVNPSEYIYQEMPDNIHIKLISIGPNWRSVLKNEVRTDLAVDTGSIDSESSDSEELIDISREGVMDEFFLRPAVNQAHNPIIKDNLTKFIIAPVMKCINTNEPIEYLTEMRQVTIVFINVVSFQIQEKETVILANESYKVVCSVVDKAKGCVNKVSLFDKDLMFIVIFGLRGFKYELECQMALNCARECHNAISKLDGVLSTSIGVTTGKTYCGVFGHTLRREYTVIGLIVNKAARLMVAYKGKVTCDRDTFLHSKLEADHFVVQEYKPLKGISHPGPVYEFIETDTDYSTVKIVYYISRVMIKIWRSDDDDSEYPFKMLVIKGEARQGKTRLLDELVYITPETISVNKILLTKKNQKIPYHTIQQIFYLPLQITPETSITEKENKIFSMLEKMRVHAMLCALNDVFGVNFNKSKLYTSMSQLNKRAVLRKLIKYLAHVCFATPWVFAIDNCEFIDDWSWTVFSKLFEIKNIFIVATMARESLNRSQECKEVIDDLRIKSTTLKPIERFHLGALVCQILDVYAISPELENAVQTKSNGNPGWVESYLISSIQDKALNIMKLTLKDIQELGLVCPPLYMMARVDMETKHKWQEIMEERKLVKGYLVAKDHWGKYIDCCRDTFLNVNIREKMEGIPQGGKVRVCTISETFSSSDNDAELSLDTMVLKTFDSLSYYEQLLVKCGAILGYQFYRKMLLYVMSAVDVRKAALAVKKLFEIKVLTCAKGDFQEEGTGIFQERLLNPEEEFEPACLCRGLTVYEQCMDLPKYASCGFLQFRSSLFRDITYNLLTDNQKKEFHHRAIDYLERETHKCKACGGGFFERILGIRHDKEFVTLKCKEKKLGDDFQWEAKSNVSKSTAYSESALSGSISQLSTSVASSASGSRASLVTSRSRSTIFPDVESKYSSVSKDPFVGISMVKKMRTSFSLTKAFSKEDFTECQCRLILSTTYAQLIEHCNGAGKLTKLIAAMMKYGYINITSSNIPLAMGTLNEALKVLERLHTRPEVTENLWRFTLIRAKIHILMGYSFLEMGHLNEAHENLHAALKQYGIKFPTGWSRQMRKCVYALKHIWGFSFSPKALIKHLDHWETVYLNDLSVCLSHLCTLYMTKNDWKNADMAATWSLTKSLASFSNFRVICTACANMIHLTQHFGRWKMCAALEVYALRICHIKHDDIMSDDLRCIAKLYGTIFTSRLHRAETDQAIHMGYIILRLCNSISAANIILPLLPYLLTILLLGKHFRNVDSILKDMHELGQNSSDLTGKVWYYAQCLAIHIETGYMVVHYDSCQSFYQLENENWIHIHETDAVKKFLTLMWLWCMRDEQWEQAMIWSEKVDTCLGLTKADSLSYKLTSLYVFEGLLLYLVHNKDIGNIIEIHDIEDRINKLLKCIENATKRDEIFFPRLYHLKAYYRHITHGDSKVQELLQKGLEFAQKHGNLLDAEWIRHSKKAWNNELKSAVYTFWKEHSDIDNTADFRELVTSERVGFFSLPTPHYK